MKMTNTILNKKLENLIAVSNKNFVLEYAYNGYRLCKKCNEGGGVTDLSERVSAAEMGRILDTLYMTFIKFN